MRTIAFIFLTAAVLLGSSIDATYRFSSIGPRNYWHNLGPFLVKFDKSYNVKISSEPFGPLYGDTLDNAKYRFASGDGSGFSTLEVYKSFNGKEHVLLMIDFDPTQKHGNYSLKYVDFKNGLYYDSLMELFVKIR